MLGRGNRRECKRVRESLSAHLDGVCGEAERAFVERHIESCADCRREYEGLRMTVDVLHRMPQAAAPRSFALRPEHLGKKKTATGGAGWLGRTRPATGVAVLAQPRTGWLQPVAVLAVLAVALLLSVDFLVLGGGEQGTHDLLATGATPTPVVGEYEQTRANGMETFSAASPWAESAPAGAGNESKLAADSAPGQDMPAPLADVGPRGPEGPEGNDSIEMGQKGAGAGEDGDGAAAPGLPEGAAADESWPVVRWVEIALGALAVGLLSVVVGRALRRRRVEV